MHRPNRTVLLAAVALAGLAAPLVACGMPENYPYPGTLQRGVVRHNHLLSVNDKNQLIVVDLFMGDIHDLGKVAERNAYWMWGDVVGNHLLLPEPQKGLVHVVELATGKTVRTLDAGAPICSLGVVGADRAFVHTGATILILDVTTGKTIHTVVVGKKTERSASGPAAWQQVGNRLFAAGSAEHAVSIIDLDSGKLVDKLEGRYGSIVSMWTDGTTLFSLDHHMAYGAMTDVLGCWNLPTKKFTQFKIGVLMENSRLAAGPNGTVYTVGQGTLKHYDAYGRHIGTMTLEPKQGQFIDVWYNLAIMAEPKLVRLVRVATAEKPVVATREIKLPRAIDKGVVQGDQFVTASSAGLAVVDLKTQKVREFNSGFIKLLPFLDVNSEAALVASKNELLVLDLATGQTKQSTSHNETIHALGFAGPGRAYLHTGDKIVIVDLKTGKPLHTIEVSKHDARRGEPPVACHRDGDRLFVADTGAILILGLTEGKIIDRIPTKLQVGSLRAAGDKLYVVGLTMGYGVWHNAVSCIDLKTKQITPLKVDSTTNRARLAEIIVGVEGSLFLLGDGSQPFQPRTEGLNVQRFDGEGKPLGTLSTVQGGQLVGVWNGHVIMVAKDMVHLVPIATFTVKKD